MENATKALLIAAGVLIGVMILSLAVSLYSELDAYVEASHETIKFNEQNKFNNQFTQYIRNDLTIQDVVTAANLAYENNIFYNATEASPSTLYVSVYLNGIAIENAIQDETSSYYMTKLLADNFTSRKYI